MKIKLQHTPGPWNEEGIYTILRYADKHDMDINESEKIMPWGTDDARLIAAAPEMLEALIWFVRRVRNGEVHSKRTYARYVEIIEKATGLTIEEVLSK